MSSGVPGTSLGNTTSITSNNYLDQVVDDSSCSSESNISSHLTQAYFGDSGISLSASTNYFVVFEFESPVKLQLERRNGSVSKKTLNLSKNVSIMLQSNEGLCDPVGRSGQA